MIGKVKSIFSEQKDIIYNFGAKIVAMLCYFSLDIASARLLGYALYDEWNYVYSIIVICNWIMRFGIDSSCRVHIANAGHDKEKQQNYLAAGIRLQIIISLMFVAIFSILSTFGIQYLGYPNKYPNLKGLMYLGIIYSSFFAILSCMKESMVGVIAFQKLFFVTAIEYISYLLIGVIGIILAKSYGLVSGYILSGGIAIWGSVKLLPIKWNKVKTKSNNGCQIEILKYAASLFMSNIGALIVTEMDTFMLGTMRNGEVGIYSIAKNLITKATNVPLAICVATMVRFAVIQKDEKKEREKKFWKIIGLNLLLLVVISLAMITCSPLLIPLLYGKQFKEAARIIMFLSIYFILYGVTLFFGTFVIYQKKSRALTIATVMMVIFNLLFNYMWIPKEGARGAAMASNVSMIPYTLILFYATVKFWKEGER